MGEKVYKPILDKDQHLVRSKTDPNRYRGLTRDGNNHNPGINEWEEYDLDDLIAKTAAPLPYEERVQLSPEQERIARQIGDALADCIVEEGIIFFREVVSPWWTNSAWPYIKEKGKAIKKAATENKKHTPRKKKKKTEAERKHSSSTELADISAQLDAVFNQEFFNMDEEEAQKHMANLVYYMLCVANEIRLISNARIYKADEPEETRIEQQEEFEKLFTEKVSTNLNKLLSQKNLKLDLSNSKKVFDMTGGGVRLYDEYAPVSPEKIGELLKSLPDTKGRKL